MDTDKIEAWMTNTRFKRMLVLLGIVTFVPMMIFVVGFAICLMVCISFDFIRGGDHWEGKWVPYSFKANNKK